jgi:hypothetical protein
MGAPLILGMENLLHDASNLAEVSKQIKVLEDKL